MKYYAILAALMIFNLLPATYVSGQQNFDEYPSPRYLLVSGADELTTQALARQLEALYNFFNNYFHLYDETSSDKLRVRLYKDRISYNDYLQSTINTVRGGYTYLHYGTSQRNELVGFISKDPEVQKTFVRQAFIQFIRDAIPHTPIWIREGFAIYFENIEFDTLNNTKIIFEPGSDWAENLRTIVKDSGDRLPFPPREILQADKTFVSRYPDIFYPMVWGFVSFLLESDNKAYNRFLWEALASMRIEYSYEENIDAIFQKAFVWLDETSLYRDFLFYIENIKTFSILVEQGILSYQEGELEKALDSFIEASHMDSTSFVSFYYQGLIHYNLGHYRDAERFFLQARNRGLDEDLSNYAFGLNAYAQGDIDTATYYLQLIPFESSYFPQAEELLSKL